MSSRTRNVAVALSRALYPLLIGGRRTRTHKGPQGRGQRLRLLAKDLTVGTVKGGKGRTV